MGVRRGVVDGNAVKVVVLEWMGWSEAGTGKGVYVGTPERAD